jgi:mRNA interferase RelE/StbE
MVYEVLLKRSAERELSGLPRPIHDRIVERLTRLAAVPRASGAVKLQGREAYRMRVGDYRVLYVVDDAHRRIEVVAVGHRRDVYR